MGRRKGTRLVGPGDAAAGTRRRHRNAIDSPSSGVLRKREGVTAYPTAVGWHRPRTPQPRTTGRFPAMNAVHEPSGPSSAASSTGIDGAFAEAARLLERDPERAAALAREGLAHAGPHPPMELLLAQADAACGRIDAAVERLQRLATEHRDWGAALFELGRLHARAGRGDEAIAALREAVRRTPALPGSIRLR